MAQVMEVVIEGLYHGQQIMNRWNYNASGTPSGVSMSFALASAMGCIPDTGAYPTGTMFEAIRNIGTAKLTFVQIITKLIYVPTDFYTAPFLTGTVGLGSTDNSEQSPTVAYGFFTNLVRRDVSRATKRFVCVQGSYVGATDSILGVTIMNFLNALATKMSDTLTYTAGGNNLSFQPCVAGKQKYTVPASGKNAYRYYPTETEQQAKLAVGIIWSPYTVPRTQTSRQFKRGA